MNKASSQALLVVFFAHGTVAAPMFTERDFDLNFINLEKPGVRGVKTNKTLENNLRNQGHHEGVDLVCGVTNQVGSATDKYEDCPAACPYFAQNRKDAKHCTFVCAPPSECAMWNGNKPIPDMIKGSKTCRGPKVSFCSEPYLDGTDSCKRCQSGFLENIEDGQCYFQYWTALYIAGAVVLVLMTVVVVWVVDLCCRETINQDEVKRAQDFRSRSKILMHKDAQGHRHVWPLETNLCKQNVAGAGMLLHFNFQAFLIFWSLAVALTWTILACFHNELFILGTRKFGTPRHNCILVSWGYETQQRLMWTKVVFLVIVYTFSFVSFLLLSIRQQRTYEQLDAEEKSMKDFAFELKGLPPLPGDGNTENLIKESVARCTRTKVIGVSVAWKYDDKEEEAIMNLVKQDQAERERTLNLASPVPESTDPPANMNSLHKKMYNAEKGLLGPDPEEIVEDIEGLLTGLKTSESAFVVFDTEEEKVKAMEVAKNGDIKLKHAGKEYTLTCEDLECEPITINWRNFETSDFFGMFMGFLKGFFTIYLPALAIWFFVFYVPYAWSLYNFNYDNGAELPGFYSIIFTMVVVGGNATMYVVCDMCCDVIGFRYKDTKQVVYMLFYLSACMINVLLDMVVTYYTALKIMVGLDFRTYDGTRIAEIDSFTEQFETYAMQRSLAENTYRYAFPSTMLIPFLIEPVVTILVPYQIGKLIIRTHREVSGTCTEAYIAAFDFDMGRYADILLNVFLALLIFYFPGGYTWSLFYGMFISHIVIYIFDHWRVLNVIPSVKIVSRQVDWWAQVTLVGCCALIMSCLVFKMNCESYSGYCLKTTGLLTACTAAGVAHFIVHLLLLIYLVPVLAHPGEKEDPNKGMKYETLAAEEASSWFSVNPVHCLRSKYIHKDKAHCVFLSVGKEHLLQVNPEIGCFFASEPAETEDFDGGSFLQTVKETSGSFKRGALSLCGVAQEKTNKAE